MNATTIVSRALASMFLLTACDVFDIGDGNNGGGSDEGGSGEEGGDAEDGADGSDADDGADGSDGADESGGVADETGAGSSDAGEGGASDGGTSGGESCGADAQECVDEATIFACIEGTAYVFSCADACAELGAIGTLGCAYDEESGVDICFCDDGSGGA